MRYSRYFVSVNHILRDTWARTQFCRVSARLIVVHVSALRENRAGIFRRVSPRILVGVWLCSSTERELFRRAPLQFLIVGVSNLRHRTERDYFRRVSPGLFFRVCCVRGN